MNNKTKVITTFSEYKELLDTRDYLNKNKEFLRRMPSTIRARRHSIHEIEKLERIINNLIEQ